MNPAFQSNLTSIITKHNQLLPTPPSVVFNAPKYDEVSVLSHIRSWDKILHVRKYVQDHFNPGKTWNFVCSVTNTCIMSLYYHKLLFNGNQFNYDEPSSPVNCTFYTVLISKIHNSFCTALSTGNHKLGNIIILENHNTYVSFSSARTNIQKAKTAIINNKCNPKNQTFNKFIIDFPSNVLTLQIKPIPLDIITIQDSWIDLLPPKFLKLKMKLNKSILKPSWTDISDVTDLAQVTIQEIQAHYIFLPK